LDPLVIQDQYFDEDEDRTISQHSVFESSLGLSIWRQALLKGRIPDPSDFEGHLVGGCLWPQPEPLFVKLSDVLATLELPRLVVRHPELLDSVLLCILRSVRQLETRLESNTVTEIDEVPQESIIKRNLTTTWTMEFVEIEPKETSNFMEISELVAQEIADQIYDEFSGIVNGLRALDQIFGYNHNLVQSWGLENDGVWSHSGWKIIPELQKLLSNCRELRELVKNLGKRPTVERSSTLRRFHPRRPDPKGSLGAQEDTMAKMAVTGLTLSNSLIEMLPSEAVLLKGHPSLKRLFWAKRMESKLQSYERSGYHDLPSVPKHKRNLYQRLPSATGGPLVLCLDTSGSMSGTRELWSKAVVLACVSAAHQQQRPCRVIAFSKGIMDAGEMNADGPGVERLLEFLKHSFGGGTDVTGALQYAVSEIILPRNDGNINTNSTEVSGAADLLLVTDGELPYPPISDSLMERLESLTRCRGLQIHGLLIGKNESRPLEKLCTKTHNFLHDYEQKHMFSAARVTSTSVYANDCEKTLPGEPILFASLRVRNFMVLGWRTGKRNAIARKRASRLGAQISPSSGLDDVSPAFTAEQEQRSASDDYNSQVAKCIDQLQLDAVELIKSRSWRPNMLKDEKTGEESCWHYRDQLLLAISLMNENLIERDEEARLAVLALIAKEHIIFLGPPGTAKSALGRRLSNLCGGAYFQRLLTRFSTPEEIFGPLSLRALENDEYKRRTENFLPQASVAFLDEIFKANSAILNTLLSILNERQFDNGGERMDCPIRCVIAASNELPESDELDALYDRFLLRKEVRSVSDDGLIKMLKLATPGNSKCDMIVNSSDASTCPVIFGDDLDQLVDSLSRAANSVLLESDVVSLLRDLRFFLKDSLDINISDRRLVKAARLLKISAATHGRKKVDRIDCLLLQHLAWEYPDQRSMIQDWLWDHLTPGTVSGDSTSSAEQFNLLLDNLRREVIEAVRNTNGDISGIGGGKNDSIALITTLKTQLIQLAAVLQEQEDNILRHIELLKCSLDHLWLGQDEARSVQQILIPKATMVLSENNRILTNTESLIFALSDKVEDSVRLSVMESLWDDDDMYSNVVFTEEELDMGMKEAKSKFDSATFRRWKRQRKKLSKKQQI
jgi:MoxR-like ATPase